MQDPSQDDVGVMWTDSRHVAKRGTRVGQLKDGKKLVTSRVKLGPGSRRQYNAQWQRRRVNDRYEGSLRKGETLDLNRLKGELVADPAGIGFGFGREEHCVGVFQCHLQSIPLRVIQRLYGHDFLQCVPARCRVWWGSLNLR